MAKAATNTKIPTSIGKEKSPILPMFDNVTRNVSKVIVDNAAPIQSNVCRVEDFLLNLTGSIKITVVRSVRAHKGTFIQKIHCQPMYVIRKPPIIGPIIPPAPIMAPWAPSPLPLSSLEKTVVIIAIPVACVMDAPRPCSTLNMIIKTIGERRPIELDSVGEIPARKDITPNRMIPVKYIDLRPIMSDSRPMGKSMALIVKDSANITHWIVVSDTPKNWAIVGRAIPTLPW